MVKIKRFRQDKLSETINFSNQVEAIDFIKSACDVFESYDHHPDVFCLRGKQLTIELTTHSLGSITQKDTQVMEELKQLIKDCCKPFNPHLF